MRIFYYGCRNNTPGHYWFKPGFINADKEAAGDSTHSKGTEVGCVPWRWDVDGGLQPMVSSKKGKTWYAPEGKALRHVKDGWTALAFWDYSVDSRMGSCSTFVAEGEFKFDQMLEGAKQNFPEVFERFNFEVTNILAT